MPSNCAREAGVVDLGERVGAQQRDVDPHVIRSRDPPRTKSSYCISFGSPCRSHAGDRPARARASFGACWAGELDDHRLTPGQRLDHLGDDLLAGWHARHRLAARAPGRACRRCGGSVRRPPRGTRGAGRPSTGSRGRRRPPGRRPPPAASPRRSPAARGSITISAAASGVGRRAELARPVARGVDDSRCASSPGTGSSRRPAGRPSSSRCRAPRSWRRRRACWRRRRARTRVQAGDRRSVDDVRRAARRSRWGRNARTPCTTPQKLTPITHSHDSTPPNHGSPPPATPALLQSTLTCPKRSSVCVASASTWSRLLTSIADGERVDAGGGDPLLGGP